MENYRHVLAMIHKLQSLKVEKMGQILCVKKVPFRKSGHILCQTFEQNDFEIFLAGQAVLQMCQISRSCVIASMSY